MWGPSDPMSTVLVRDSLMSAVGNSKFLDAERCRLRFEATDLSLNGSEIVLGALDDVTLELEQTRVHGVDSHHIAAGGKRLVIQISNSLLEDVGFDLSTTDTVTPGSQVTVENSTLIYRMNSALGQGCDANPNLVTRYENSIIASLGAFDSLTASAVGCGSHPEQREEIRNAA